MIMIKFEEDIILFRLYFFNTTNPEGFLKGEKPFLVEVSYYCS